VIKVVGTSTTPCEEAGADAIKAAGPVHPGPSGRRGGQAHIHLGMASSSTAG
jgi:hypothetical protein